MELDITEALAILKASSIEIDGADPRTPLEIATQYILTDSVALETNSLMEDCVTRVKAEIAWQK